MTTPDTKDWTWVLHRPCPDCGFEASAIAREEVGGLIRANAASWTVLLTERPTAELRRRPADEVWSDLEYACHVRDVLRMFRVRLRLMLDQDGSLFPSWNQNEAAVADGYNEQDPARVASELSAAAAELASAFESVSGEQWQRSGERGDGAKFTADSLARYLIHDVVHHLHDVTASDAEAHTDGLQGQAR